MYIDICYLTISSRSTGKEAEVRSSEQGNHSIMKHHADSLVLEAE